MNKIKQLFIIGLCLALTLTTTLVVGNHPISPCDHYVQDKDNA